MSKYSNIFLLSNAEYKEIGDCLRLRKYGSWLAEEAWTREEQGQKRAQTVNQAKSMGAWLLRCLPQFICCCILGFGKAVWHGFACHSVCIAILAGTKFDACMHKRSSDCCVKILKLPVIVIDRHFFPNRGSNFWTVELIRQVTSIQHSERPTRSYTIHVHKTHYF